MGIQVLPNPQNHSPRCGLHLVDDREVSTIDLPLYASGRLQEQHDHLGCIRGIAIAIAIQTAVVALSFALWKLI